jgi:DNA invertase Pin-like site-specific DNA recombinase
MSGTHRARPGLDQALAAAQSNDTLVVPKLVIVLTSNKRS